ncbi:hypothetical protein B0H10DRAFT_2236110 [Mycena sp. CBHHK59/15]|nr:hypothetical protein B0H10DRAFT_2236110 [Mycena sp. CBHHK59/15]
MSYAAANSPGCPNVLLAGHGVIFLTVRGAVFSDERGYAADVRRFTFFITVLAANIVPLAEAAIHNTYIAMGMPRIVCACLGALCCIKHREFFSLAKIGGLRAMDRTIRAVLACLGETRVRRDFLPVPPGFEDLHCELCSSLPCR